MSGITRRLFGVGLAMLLGVGVNADEAAETPVQPYGSLFRALAGDTLEREHGVAVLGFAHVSIAEANHNLARSPMPLGRGRNVQPQGGVVQHEGLNLQHVGLMACKGAGCPPGRPYAPNRNVLSRIGPLPGSDAEHVIVDWNVSAIYGEDGLYWSLKGFDDWAWNADDDHRLAITQWYLDVYLPVARGASLLVGSWHSPLAAEIGYPFVPPNLFSSRTYAFMAGPAKHLGALLEMNLPLAPAYGYASASFGLTSDWNSVDFGSGAGGPSFMFGARWRSPDLRTWVDIETIYGNGEDDFGDVVVKRGVAHPRGGGSQYLALSSTDAYLDRFLAYLTVRHMPHARLDVLFEAVYGFQEGGDLAPVPFAITRDANFYGANLGFRYQFMPRWYAGARAEWFADDAAANVLWGSVGAGGGDVYALTLGLSWEPVPWVLVRPELKYDHYTGRGRLFAPDRNGLATENNQLLGVLNFEFRF